MILCIDVGNTTTKIGFYKDANINAPVYALSSFATNKSISSDELFFKLCEVLKSVKVSFHQIQTLCLSCVVPKLSFAWEKATWEIKDSFNKEIVFVNLNIDIANKLPPEIWKTNYPNPAEIGADYIAAAIGARQLYSCPLAFVDLGTATNIGFLDTAGTFIGGIVCPGVATSLSALTNNASALGEVRIEPPNKIIGRSTQDAIKSGILYGAASQIDGLINLASVESNLNFNCVLTGGFSRTISKIMKTKADISRDLVLSGLRVVYGQLNQR